MRFLSRDWSLNGNTTVVFSGPAPEVDISDHSKRLWNSLLETVPGTFYPHCLFFKLQLLKESWFVFHCVHLHHSCFCRSADESTVNQENPITSISDHPLFQKFSLFTICSSSWRWTVSEPVWELQENKSSSRSTRHTGIPMRSFFFFTVFAPVNLRTSSSSDSSISSSAEKRI